MKKSNTTYRKVKVSEKATAIHVESGPIAEFYALIEKWKGLADSGRVSKRVAQKNIKVLRAAIHSSTVMNAVFPGGTEN